MDDRDSRTPFSVVYNNFLSKITDDMFLELDTQETIALMQELLINAIPKFEFPRVNLDYDLTFHQMDHQGHIYRLGTFNYKLTNQEINILSTYMIVEWIGYQLASIENVRMKYSGSDFKFTSQANHMQKLLQMKKDYDREGFHLQRLYKRRIRDSKGIYHSTFGQIMAEPMSYRIGYRDDHIPEGSVDAYGDYIDDLDYLKDYIPYLTCYFEREDDYISALHREEGFWHDSY